MNWNGTPIMHPKDSVFAALAECFVTIDDVRYNFMQAINLEAHFEKNKTEVPILGKTGKGNKATGWKGTGSATFHYNTSIFRQMMERYKNTGVDVYFDIQITNEDLQEQISEIELFIGMGEGGGKGHISASVTDAEGVHGLRFNNDELQVKDGEGNWKSAGGGADAVSAHNED